MLKNPFLNAVAAGVYIILIALLMQYGLQPIDVSAVPKLLFPMVMLSLLTLSAAVMGALFFLQPAQLYIDGKKKEALNVFFKTVGTFAALTAIILLVVLIGGRS